MKLSSWRKEDFKTQQFSTFNRGTETRQEDEEHKKKLRIIQMNIQQILFCVSIVLLQENVKK